MQGREWRGKRIWMELVMGHGYPSAVYPNAASSPWWGRGPCGSGSAEAPPAGPHRRPRSPECQVGLARPRRSTACRRKDRSGACGPRAIAAPASSPSVPAHPARRKQNAIVWEPRGDRSRLASAPPPPRPSCWGEALTHLPRRSLGSRTIHLDTVPVTLRRDDRKIPFRPLRDTYLVC